MDHHFRPARRQARGIQDKYYHGRDRMASNPRSAICFGDKLNTSAALVQGGAGRMVGRA